MRYLLLVFLLALQGSVFGYSSNNRAENYVQKILTSEKSDLNARSFLDFLYQGQYFDEETELAYNRFRYYDSSAGVYISQDPIRLSGGNNFYGYVYDCNSWVDPFGLYSDLLGTGMGHHIMPRSIAKNLGIDNLSPNNAIAWYPNNGSGTADLHKQLHRKLIEQGVPYHGSRFTGTAEEFFEAAKKAYKGIDTKGYMKIPYTDKKLLQNLTPLEAVEKLEDLYKKGKIPNPCSS